eukprot:2632361-Rhodomonas_salina.2
MKPMKLSSCTSAHETRSSQAATTEGAPELSSDIACEPSLKSSLLGETTKAVNKVAKVLRRDDPGLVVEISSPADLHAALGYAGSPLLQGASIEESRIAFVNWLAAQALRVPGVSPNNKIGDTAWASFTSSIQAMLVLSGQWMVVSWVASIQQAGFAAPPARVLYMEGTGPGRCTMCTLPQIFG